MTQNLADAAVRDLTTSELLEIEKLIQKKSTRKIFRLIFETCQSSSDKDGWIQITQSDIASSLEISRSTVNYGCRDLILLGLIEAKVENNANWYGSYYRISNLLVKLGEDFAEEISAYFGCSEDLA